MADNQEFNLLEQYSKAEKFVTENKKSLGIILGSAAVLVLLYFGYQRFYLAPREQEAAAQMYVAEKYFETDSLDKALNGDGNFPGFITIADEYSGTKAGNLANYYLGICYLKKGKFEEAIDALENYDGEDILISTIALGAIGDAYSEMNNQEKAIEYYEKATESNPNRLTTPIYLMRLANIYENMNDNSKALDAYTKIKKEFSDSQENRDIDKYIARVQAKL